MPVGSKGLQVLIAFSVSIFLSVSCSTSQPSESRPLPGEPSPKTSSESQGTGTESPAIETHEVVYSDGKTNMIGYVAYPKGATKRPAVLVIHEWWGQTEYPRKRAEMLAELGYVAMALDLYGDRAMATHPKSAQEFSQSISKQPRVRESRFRAAMDYIQKLPQVDPRKIAAIGYCFGGGVVLEMARAGLDIDAVASFHGPVTTSNPAKKDAVKAKVFVFNGAADPLVKKEDIEALTQEMKKAGASFEIIQYENAKHAFTNPNATALGTKFDMPLEYDPAADKDSWEKLKAILNDLDRS